MQVFFITHRIILILQKCLTCICEFIFSWKLMIFGKTRVSLIVRHNIVAAFNVNALVYTVMILTPRSMLNYNVKSVIRIRCQSLYASFYYYTHNRFTIMVPSLSWWSLICLFNVTIITFLQTLSCSVCESRVHSLPPLWYIYNFWKSI